MLHSFEMLACPLPLVRWLLATAENELSSVHMLFVGGHSEIRTLG